MNENQIPSPDPMPDPYEQAVARRIACALEAPAPRQAFVDALGGELNREFAARQRVGEGAATSSLARLLDARSHGWSEPSDDAALRREVRARRRELRDLAGAPNARLRLGRKLAIAAVLGAVLISSVWSESGYSWSRMIGAMRQQDWVRIDSMREDGTPLVQWVSTRRGVSAGRGPTTSSYIELRDQYQNQAEDSETRPGRQLVESLVDTRRTRPDVESQLFTLLADSSRTFDPGGTKERLRVEQDRPEVVPEGVAIRVTMSRAGRSVRARFLLDAQTRLPIWCELPDQTEPGSPDSPRKLVFSYPTEGPSFAAMLGAPGDTLLACLDPLRLPAR
jgi:hypothetical protein